MVQAKTERAIPALGGRSRRNAVRRIRWRVHRVPVHVSVIAAGRKLRGPFGMSVEDPIGIGAGNESEEARGRKPFLGLEGNERRFRERPEGGGHRAGVEVLVCEELLEGGNVRPGRAVREVVIKYRSKDNGGKKKQQSRYGESFHRFTER